MCHSLCIPQKNDSWECGRQHRNHFLALFEPLWLHRCLYYHHTMMAPTANVVFSLILECLSQKVPTPQWHPRMSLRNLYPTLCPSFSLNSVVSVWVYRLCHHAAVPPHSSQTSSWLSWILTREKEREKNRAEGWNYKQRDVKRGWPMWDHRCCDAMEILVAFDAGAAW